MAVIVASAEDRRFALWFCAGAVLTLLIFRLGAYLAMRLAARVAVGRPVWLRLGVASLYRPASDAPLLITSLGLGLATLATIALITGNLREQLAGALPARAPSFFFIDIQNDQLDRFTSIVQGEPGVSDLHQVPSLRARIVALNGVPAEQVHVAGGQSVGIGGGSGADVFRNDPGGLDAGGGCVVGAGYDGPPLLSLDDGLAHGWGLHVGDTLRANVLGRDIDFRVANLRAIDWRGLNLNFTLVASPGLLEHAPHMHIATVRTTPGAGARLLRAVNDALPNVTGIRVADVIEAVAGVLEKLAAALSVAGAVTLVSGALVLAGAIAAGQRRRINEAVILKTLGGTRTQVRAAWLVQFWIVGAVTGIIAAGLGTLASWAVMHFALDAAWAFLPWVLFVTIIGCMVLMVACGYAGTAVALRTRVAPYLRNQ